MRDLTKAQVTIGLLSYFSTIALVVKRDYLSLIDSIGIIILQLILVLILSYVILAILEWIRIFDLKINSILTFLFLVTFVYIAYFANLM